MGAGHSHDPESAPRATQRTSVVLGALVAVVVVLTAIGAGYVWPTDYSYMGSIPSTFEGATWVEARVDGVDPETGNAQVTVTSESPPLPGTLEPTGFTDLIFEEGDVLKALRLDTGELVFSDFERGPSMLALFLVYVALVLLVARWKGLGALLGLAAAFGIVIFFTVPALFGGGSPLIIGLVTGSGALFALLYLAHGVNARTTTAYLGTLAGLLMTTFLAWWAVGASKLTGVWSEDGGNLQITGHSVSLSGLVLCGVILAGLGVLNDVTVTQASAVWELRAARPDIARWNLFQRGMRIGRDHIASTVYTMAFVYVGAALPSIMLVTLYDNSLLNTMTSADIAEEIVRTLVGSIGLVMAVPLTTGIACLVVGRNSVMTEPAHDVIPEAAHDVIPATATDAEAGPAPSMRSDPEAP
jgi:uncharacterized membrane protein